MELTEERKIVFWTYVHALLCIYFWLQDDKITLILYTNAYIFKVSFNQESWQYEQ